MNNALSAGLLSGWLMFIGFACTPATEPPLVSPDYSGDPEAFFLQSERWDSLVSTLVQAAAESKASENEGLAYQMRLLQAYDFLGEQAQVEGCLKVLDSLYSAPADTLTQPYATYLLLKTQYLWSTRQSKQAINIHEKSRALRNSMSFSEKLEALWWLNEGRYSMHQEKVDQARTCYQKAGETLSGEEPKEVSFKLKIMSKVAGFFIRIGNHHEAATYLAATSRLREQHPEIWADNWIPTLFQWVSVNQILGRYALAEDHMREIAELYEASNASSLMWGRYYWLLGNLMRPMGNEDEAEAYYLQALSHYEYATHARAGLNQNIALIHNSRGAYQVARDSMEMVKELYLSMGPARKKSYGRASMNLGRILTNMESWQAAEENLSMGIRVFSSDQARDDILYSLSVKFLGETYQQQGKQEKALEAYRKAYRYAKNKLGEHSFVAAQALANIASILQQQGQYGQALAEHQQALQCVFPLQSLQNPRVNPRLAKTDLEKEVFGFLTQKAHLLQTKGQQENDREDLELSLETFLLAQQWADTMRLKINSEADKLLYLEKIHRFYPQALSLVWELYKREPKEAYLAQAFYFIEKSRANLLLENRQEGQALANGQLSQETLDFEKSLRQKVANAEKRVYDLGKSELEKTKSALAFARSRLFSLRKQYDSLQVYLEEHHPEYYRLKYDLRVQSLAETQAFAQAQNQGILEYFTGDSVTYIFYVGPDTAQLFRQENTAQLAEAVIRLQAGISAFHTASIGHKTQALRDQSQQQYRESAHQLYAQLIKPVEDQHDLPQKLLIIPDGSLGYVPFDALLTAAVDEHLPYSDYPFLIHQHEISYCFSQTLMEEMCTNPIRNMAKGVLGIALDFKELGPSLPGQATNTKDRLGRLNYSLEEVEAIGKVTRLEPLFNEAATKEQVCQLVEQFPIIHFSTHGILDNEDSDLSFLALAGANFDSDSGRLNIRDLYTLNLQAELVVLSACETSLGKASKGEGIISMARGFSYAGASSIITTLWQVEELSTASILSLFYQYVKAGFSKSSALRQAKLDYMTQAESQFDLHPFFWAASTPMGDMEPIRLPAPASQRSWLWGVLAVLILLIGLYSWKRWAQPPS
ncbi:MAG: CHAT domain-containing tetratricopeptide repeat protein [Bacteroidota bacterium]